MAEIGRIRWANPTYHAKVIEIRKDQATDPVRRAKEVARNKARQSDPVHIAKEVERQKRRRLDPKYRSSQILRGRKRRADPAYRANISKFGKKWYALNKGSRSAKSKAWYEKNRDALLARRSTPSARDKINKWTKAYLTRHPHLKVHRSVGSAIAEILKACRIIGSFRHLPYSRADLRLHLERQFVRGMSWDNYGSAWHVDHILPQSSFTVDPSDPSNCPEFQACWALTNLRPLWKHDNQVKSAKRTLLL